MTIAGTGFGWIETDSRRFNHDVVAYPDGTIQNRYEHLKGPNHVVSLDEARVVLAGTKADLVVGTGQFGMVRVPDETRRSLAGLGVNLHIAATPEAVLVYNRLAPPKCAIFHVTC